MDAVKDARRERLKVAPREPVKDKLQEAAKDTPLDRVKDTLRNPLTGIAELVCRETGIAVPAARQPALRAAVGRAAAGLDTGTFLRVASDPVRGRDLVQRLIDEVTTQETAFARDRGQLDGIPWHDLRRSALAAGSAAIRVWSAGCATGEEAYTLALLADQALGPGQAPVDVLGTDISGAALAAAAAGRYRERAVRSLRAPERDRYLGQQRDGDYLVGMRLRGLVRFRRHNLARDPLPPPGEAGFDLVACRNVLIYFEQPLACTVIAALERSLRPGGLLMLGAADALRRAPRPASTAAGLTGTALTSAPRAGTTQAGTARAGTARAGSGPLRRPLGRHPAHSREQRLAAALNAADNSDRAEALAQVESLIADNPLDADAHFVQGLLTLAAGEPGAAAAALRRALYIDTRFALAAFTLGRAYDALGDEAAARRAYQRVLRTLDAADHRHDLILQQVDIGDVVAACHVRLGGRP
ncbi:MAG: CheR family methyltransferase [Streptosporangiaceae bacterium]